MNQSTSGPTVLSVIKDIVLALANSKGNEQLIRDTVQAELSKSNNSKEHNDMLRHLLVTVESRKEVELREACQQRDFYKARAEEMSQKWKAATKEKKTAESQEKMQMLLGKLLDVSESRRNQAAGGSQFRGGNRPNVQGNNYEPADHLPWQDQPKGGQWNKGKVYNEPQFQKTDNDFFMVNHNNYTPHGQQNKGKVYNKPQFQKNKDDFCVVNHNDYTPRGRGAGRGRGGGRGRSLSHGRQPHNNSSVTQTYARQGEGVQNKSKPTNQQGGANKNNNFRGRGRGRGNSQQRGGKNHQSANEFPCELNARMNNLSVNVSYNPSSGNNQRPRNNNRGGNQSRGHHHNRSQQNESREEEGCVIC